MCEYPNHQYVWIIDQLTELRKKYGVDSYSKLDEYKQKVKQTLLDKYGSKSYINVDKIKSTMLDRYGWISRLIRRRRLDFDRAFIGDS